MLNAFPPDLSRVRTAKQFLDGIALETFDETLGYLDPLPASFPRIIGPHGDHELGQGSMEHFVQYVLHTTFDALNFWRETDVGALPAVKDFFRVNARALQASYRAWGMTAEIVLPDDHKRILQDQEASSGIRSYGFHREILVLEYLYAGRGLRVHSGRKTVDSSRTFIRSFGDAFTQMVGGLVLRNPSQALAQFTGRHGAISNTGPNGWAAEFYFDFSDFWNSLDAYAYDAMGFFHAIPAPPCAPGTHAENGFCVPD
jgi:hypothetical protein